MRTLAERRGLLLTVRVTMNVWGELPAPVEVRVTVSL